MYLDSAARQGPLGCRPRATVAEPSPGNRKQLLHWPITRRPPASSTGAKGLPVATRARPPVQASSSAGTASARLVGLESRQQRCEVIAEEAVKEHQVAAAQPLHEGVSLQGALQLAKGCPTALHLQGQALNLGRQQPLEPKGKALGRRKSGALIQCGIPEQIQPSLLVKRSEGEAGAAAAAGSCMELAGLNLCMENIHHPEDLRAKGAIELQNSGEIDQNILFIILQGAIGAHYFCRHGKSGAPLPGI